MIILVSLELTSRICSQLGSEADPGLHSAWVGAAPLFFLSGTSNQPGNFLLRVITDPQKSKTTYASSFSSSACIRSANMPLAKANYIAKLQIEGQGRLLCPQKKG